MTIFTNGKASLDMTTHPNYTANIAGEMPRSSGADLVFKAPLIQKKPGACRLTDRVRQLCGNVRKL